MTESSVVPHGVPAHTQGGTPSPLPPDQWQDALDTIEFAEVVELVAALAVGPMGAARASSPEAAEPASR